jgi:spore coat protein CotH
LTLGVALWLSAVVVGQNLPGVSEDKNIFGLEKMHRVHVSMTKAEWDVLQTSSARNAGGVRGSDYVAADGRLIHIGGGFGGYFPWVHADLLVNGKELKDIGFRYKGNNSFATSNAARPLRANFKVKTDLYGGKPDWNGVETLNFHAGVQDPSLTREALAYAIFRAAGVPASRTGYVEMTFNVPGVYENTSGGFYTLIENVNKQFLKNALPPGTGLLMKPEGTRGGVQSLGTNWASYVATYRPERDATPEEQKRMIEFAGLISQNNTALFREKIGTYLDVDNFLRFIAVNIFIVNNDSYLNGNHNYYLYLDPKDDKFRFIPWDQDLSMGGMGGRGNAEILKPTAPNNPLIYWLLDDPAVAERYRAIVRELADSAFSVPVLNQMIAEVEKTTSIRDSATKAFLINRATYVQSLFAGTPK